jgi:hypothetical protein
MNYLILINEAIMNDKRYVFITEAKYQKLLYKMAERKAKDKLLNYCSFITSL